MEINFTVSARTFPSSGTRPISAHLNLSPGRSFLTTFSSFPGGMRREIFPLRVHIEGHVLVRISREHRAMNVKDQST